MSASASRTPNPTRKSIFFQDLSTPISSTRSRPKPQTPSQSSAAPWRHQQSNLPPPPAFTLEDRSDFSPEFVPVMDFSPEPRTEAKFPFRRESEGLEVLTPKSKSGGERKEGFETPIGGGSWWSVEREREGEDKGKGSPVEGVVNSGALITLPPPREVARPEIKRSSVSPVGNLDEEEWVTVFGFSPAETNMVLREFEKCGVILKHVTGPREANWMHILYQNRFDAQKALSKNGSQLNGVIIIGVKPVDPMQCQALNDKLNHQGFMPLPPLSSRTLEPNSFKASSRPYLLQNGSSNTQAGGTVAAPTKSYMSKIVDLMFGV